MLLDGQPGVVVERVGRVVYVDQRVAEQLAHLTRLEQREIGGALADPIGYVMQNPGTLSGERVRPGAFVESLASRAYGAPRVGQAALGHHREGSLGRRVDDLVGVAALRAGPLPGDVHLVGLELLLDDRHHSPPGRTHGRCPCDTPYGPQEPA